MSLIRNIVAGIRLASFFVVTLSGIILYPLGMLFGSRGRRFFAKTWWAAG